MNVLLIGAGRMGLRHLRGLSAVEGQIVIVDTRNNSKEDVFRCVNEFGVKSDIKFVSSLNEISIPSNGFDAAILSTTAHLRLEQFLWAAEHDIKNILVEKPLEQSRAKCREIQKIARANDINVRCNHYRRTLPFFTEIKKSGGPYHIIVNTGAFGLACNGIHWLDFGIYMTGSKQPKLLFGKIDPTIVKSGRGEDFRDYGGCGFFAFEDGSRLILNSSADSSAPTAITITQPRSHCIIDQESDLIILYERDKNSTKPNYLYGADYTRKEIKGAESVKLWDITTNWINSISHHDTFLLPSLEDALVGHELLFDLLETSGKTEFPIT